MTKTQQRVVAVVGCRDTFAITDDGLREAAVIRSTSAAGCKVVNPTPFNPSWLTVIDTLDRNMKR